MTRKAVIYVDNPKTCPHYYDGKCHNGLFNTIMNCSKYSVIKDKGVEYFLPVFPDFCPLKEADDE